MPDASVKDASIKTVDRVVTILRVLSRADAHGISLSEICTAAELRKTTAHRILGALVESGLLFQDTSTRYYRLGSAAAALGRSALEQDIAGAARHSLVRIARRCSDTVFASVREGTAAICVAREVGSFPIRTLTLDIGDRRPLGVGAGSLALLAAIPDLTAKDIIDRNQAWLADFERFSPAELWRLVERTRKLGYALNEGRIVSGMSAIGVPVLDSQGELIASLSLAAIKDRMGPERIPELVQLLKDEAQAIADMLRPVGMAAE